MIAILILLPLLFIIIILVRYKLGKPVIFRQQRPGRDEKLFTLYKFKTMTERRDEQGELLPDKDRLTSFGNFLRATSLDELPELINILKGDMSFIGPRPLLVHYLDLYSDEQRRRHIVRPGLSGLAQVNGRNAISWEEKFDLDLNYINNITFLGDMRLICLTVRKVIKREGIHSQQSVSMELFQGNKKVLDRTLQKDRLLIIGASGHGKVIGDIAKKMNKWKTIAYLDDNEQTKRCMEYEVLGSSKEAKHYIKDHELVIAIGNNRIREQLMRELGLLGATFPILVHPSAIIGAQVEIGEGTVIMAGAVVNCCSRVGKGCIINTCTSIDHDNVLDDYVHISPGAHTAGSVSIGKGTWLGIGSTVINNVNITSNCIIGGGAVVTKNIMEEGTYIGVPAYKSR
jgi:sugar O-acyltransferase (sialic acid O-acetyltransferase NeuD family)